MKDPILPPASLGMIGGGQLGRMFTMAAKTMGYQVVVLEPERDCPAASIADRHICARYDDAEALSELANACHAVTTEFENVPASSLELLARTVRVAPSAKSVSIAQDRICEKAFLTRAGLDVAPYLEVENLEKLDTDLSSYLPGILKVARLGYDGKGQIRVSTAAETIEAFSSLGNQACVLEKMLDLRLEVSVIVARTGEDAVTTFPVAENRHENGILDVSIIPARIHDQLAESARNIALRVADALDYVGVLGVEMFILGDDRILVNEIAPRPHNSGHYTLDATLSSQFEQQVRTLCGLPPASTKLLSPCVMVNLLGDLWNKNDPNWMNLLEDPRVLLHLYGKHSARPGRKMGHFNLLAENLAEALDTAIELKLELNSH